MKNVSDKICRENQKTHFYTQYPFFSEIMPLMRQCEKGIARRGKPQLAI
jgi:hypothetical protein